MNLPHRIGSALLAACALLPLPLRAQCPDGTPPPCGRTARAAPATTSVAVLYFENLSRDTTDAYLVDGLTEELTSRLGAVTRLRVTGRSVVRHAQRTAGGDVVAVGRVLNVRYVVEGSLRRSGPRVRVSARLLRASDGVRVWGDDYDRTMDDLLALQEDIAREVAGNVAGQLLPGEQRALARRPTTSAEAYDHYLHAKYLVTRRTEAAITQAAAELDQALRLDPGFAAAEARRAQTFELAFAYGIPLATPESLAARAQRSADRAVQLDPGASDTWMAVGLVRFWFPPVDLDASRAALERAAAIDPRNADAFHNLGVVLMTVPDLPAASAALTRALALEPGRGVSLLDLAQVEYSARRFDAARRYVDSALALEPQQARIYMLRALLRLRSGETAGARSDAEAGVRLSTAALHSFALAALIIVKLAQGDSVAARGHMAAMDLSAMPMALVLAAFGQTEPALDVLERGPLLAIDRSWLWWPEFDSLRASPRFARAVEAWAPRGARRP